MDAPTPEVRSTMSSSQLDSLYLDPKLDVVFKALFGRQSNAELLVGLLNGILELPEAERIESVQILSPLLELEGVRFSAHLAVVLAQLPKFQKPAAEASGQAEQWASFLREGTKMGAQTQGKPWLTPALRKAIEELKRLEGDPQLREVYEARRRYVQLQATLLRESYEDGLEQGLERGLAQGLAQKELATREIARHLLEEGATPERVARLTGLAPDVISSLSR